MKNFWENKFEELATFNTDKNKNKYNEVYLSKMAELQKEYNDEQIKWAKINGYVVLTFNKEK